jgi:hypothetical protein
LRDSIIAAVRTTVQTAIGTGVAYLAAQGITVDPAVESAALVVIVGLVTLGLNELQKRVPFVGKLLSVGLSESTPSY